MSGYSCRCYGWLWCSRWCSSCSSECSRLWRGCYWICWWIHRWIRCWWISRLSNWLKSRCGCCRSCCCGSCGCRGRRCCCNSWWSWWSLNWFSKSHVWECSLTRLSYLCWPQWNFLYHRINHPAGLHQYNHRTSCYYHTKLWVHPVLQCLQIKVTKTKSDLYSDWLGLLINLKTNLIKKLTSLSPKTLDCYLASLLLIICWSIRLCHFK